MRGEAGCMEDVAAYLSPRQTETGVGSWDVLKMGGPELDASSRKRA